MGVRGDGLQRRTSPQDSRPTERELAAIRFLFYFAAQLLHFLADLFAVFGVGKQLQVARIGLNGLFLQAFFFLRLAEVFERDGIAGLGGGGILKAIDGRVDVALPHVILADFDVFFRAQRVPSGLVGCVLCGAVRFVLLVRLFRRRIGRVGRLRG